MDGFRLDKRVILPGFTLIEGTTWREHDKTEGFKPSKNYPAQTFMLKLGRGDSV